MLSPQPLLSALAPKTRTIGPCSQALARTRNQSRLNSLPLVPAPPARLPTSPPPPPSLSTCFRGTRWGTHPEDRDYGPWGRGPGRAPLRASVIFRRGSRTLPSCHLSLRGEGSWAPLSMRRPKATEICNLDSWGVKGGCQISGRSP